MITGIRLNQIRHNDGAVGPSGTIGITLNSVADGIVEENLIGIGATPGTPLKTHALIRDSSATVKTFNNQSSTGAFIGSWSGSKHDGDLVTDVEAAVMGL